MPTYWTARSAREENRGQGLEVAGEADCFGGSGFAGACAISGWLKGGLAASDDGGRTRRLDWLGRGDHGQIEDRRRRDDGSWRGRHS